MASSDDEFTTAIFGFSMSASVRPSARHCARRTAQNEVPGSKLLRSFRVMSAIVGLLLGYFSRRPALEVGPFRHPK